MKLLLIEDEKELASEIIIFLKNEGYICESANNYDSASLKLNIYEYDCAIIDITLPGGSGLDLIKLLKSKSPKTGIVIISAKNSLDDKIKGLDLGADDYVTKPFYLAELNSRIKSVLRRRNFDGKNIVEFEEIEIDTESREVTVNNKVVQLTRKEYEMLLYFITNTKRVLTKETIAEHLWGDNADAFDNLDFMYTHIRNLRKKLLYKGCKDYITTIYGIGYKFTKL